MVKKINPVKGNIVNVWQRKIIPGEIILGDGRIKKIIESNDHQRNFIIPGLIDAHVHIESSMLIPSEFARIAVRHGTVATISDPHEIANVLGMKGIDFMIRNGESVPFKFYFGAPSCVPATKYETSGRKIEKEDIKDLFLIHNLKYLAEVMNFPAVLNRDKDILEKISIARRYRKKIDGHAPGLMGKDLKKYFKAGITTDHETTDIEEGKEKICLGMKLLIREGSAAKNFDKLIPLLAHYPGSIMFCTDDIHPDDLIEGHINNLIRKGINYGYNIFDLIRAATVNPVMHYGLDVGLLREGDPADFVVIENLETMTVRETYINGNKVYCKGQSKIISVRNKNIKVLNCNKINKRKIQIKTENSKIKVIQAFDGDIFTKRLNLDLKGENEYIRSDPEKDILKIVVYNRYLNADPAVALIKGFGLKYGAMGSTIAHDSHNIIAIGVEDEYIVRVVNRLIDLKGGIVVYDGKRFKEIQLEVAGIMTGRDGDLIGKAYKNLNKKVRFLGSALKAPFMTMSFMALLVIPELKISDKGLFDVTKFKLTDLY